MKRRDEKSKLELNHRVKYSVKSKRKCSMKKKKKITETIKRIRFPNLHELGKNH